MPIFDTLQKASFDGVEIPVEEQTVFGELRDHIHEFPHTAGGMPEKMGRRNYIYTLTVPFFTGIVGYPDLWPTRLAAIRGSYELQRTAPTHIPTIGTVDCYIRSIRQHMTGKIRNGERVELVLVEDNPLDWVTNQLISDGQSGLKAQNDALQNEGALSDTSFLSQIKDGLASIDDAVNAVLGVQDTVEIYSLTVEAKLERLAIQLDALNRAIRVDSGANASRVLDALLDLWLTTINTTNDIKNKGSDLRTWTTPALISVAEISTRLYGDTSRQIELMQLNPFDDVYAVPPNFVVRYYPPEAA